MHLFDDVEEECASSCNMHGIRNSLKKHFKRKKERLAPCQQQWE
jgi:hypothetical protein